METASERRGTKKRRGRVKRKQSKERVRIKAITKI